MSMAGINYDHESFDGRDISSSFFSEKELSHPIFYYKQQELIAMRNGAWKIFIKNPNPRGKEFSDDDWIGFCQKSFILTKASTCLIMRESIVKQELMILSLLIILQLNL